MSALRTLLTTTALVATTTAWTCAAPANPTEIPGNNAISGISFGPAMTQIMVGEVAWLHCLALNDAGTGVLSNDYSYDAPQALLEDWTSSDTHIADRGYKGIKEGMATVTCTVKGKNGNVSKSVTVDVRAPVVSLTPSTTVISPSETKILVPDARNPFTGATLTGLTWTYASNATGVATATALTQSAGVTVRGVTPGVAVITASFRQTDSDVKGAATATVNVAGSLTITTPSAVYTVTVGNSVSIAVTVRDAAGNTVSNPTLTFSSSSNYTVLSSTSSSVLVRPLASGQHPFTITASANGLTGSTTVTLNATAAPPATAQLVTAGSGTPIGGTRQLIGVMPTGEIMTFAAMAGIAGSYYEPTVANQVATGFTSSNTAVATVSSTGVVTGVSAGSAVITGQWTSGGVDYQATLLETVGTPTTASPQLIFVSTLPGLSSSIRVGKVTAYRCGAENPTGTPIVATPTWTSSNPAVATVNSAGIVTGVSAGSATMTCNINTRTSTGSVTVTP